MNNPRNGIALAHFLCLEARVCGHRAVAIPIVSVASLVTAAVDDDGLVHIEGDDLSLVRWNHRPALLREALHRFGGMAVWKPRWYVLAVPTEAFMGGARTVFSLAALDERHECYVHRTTNPDHYEASRVAPGSPPLKMAPRYAAGRVAVGASVGRLGHPLAVSGPNKLTVVHPRIVKPANDSSARDIGPPPQAG